MDELDTSLDRLWEDIYIQRPTLKKVLDQYGESSVLTYVHEHLCRPSAASKRGEELLTVLQTIATQRLPRDVAETLVTQLENNFVVSTVDHHGPLSHPFFLNANFLMTAWVQKYISGKVVVPVLSTASVSLNNSSFPRGFLYHSQINEYERLALLPARSGMQPVYSIPAYGDEAIAHLQSNIDAAPLATNKRAYLSDALSEVAAINKADSRYAEQVTRINHELWKLLSRTWEASLPDLVTIEQEQLVADLLCAYHLGNHTLLTEVLCNSAWHEAIIEHCAGIQGAFDFGSGYGTFLFWSKETQSSQRTPLLYKDGALVSADGLTSFSLTADVLKNALQNRQLIPSTLLCFIVINFYYGLECFGGFSQTEYQTAMQQAFSDALEGLGEHAEAEWVKQRSTKNMIEGIGISFLESKDGPALATLMDLLLWPSGRGREAILKTMDSLTLRESITSFLPEIYPIITRTSTFPYSPSDCSQLISRSFGERIHAAAGLGAD
jgi:hypothetical protein